MSRIDRDRRKFLAAGSTAAAISLAGCSSVILNRIGGGDEGHGGGEDEGGEGGEGGGGMDQGENVPEEVHSYLSENETNLYEGEAADETGSDEVTVEVGGGDGGLAFDPPAVLVDAGATVTWEWVGNGGQHNVESDDQSGSEFRSGEAVESDSETYSQSFEESSNQLYYCNPHQAIGMYGAVIVE
jgi:halocyanin-like protein